MTQAEMERKLNQHGDDILALYGLVEDFRSEVNRRFDGVDRRFDGVDQRLDSLDANVAEILRRLPA